MFRASNPDRAYFERIARQSRALEDESVPASLAEMFDRLERIHRTHGELALPGVEGSDEGDLEAHLAFLRRSRRIQGRGAHSS